MFREFRLAICRFMVYSEESGAKLPVFKADIFFDQKFKEIIFNHACKTPGKECEDCLLNLKCPFSFMYKNIFLQTWKNQRFGPVAPFSWEPPLEKRTVYLKGEKIFFNLMLLGSAIEFLEVMIASLKDYLAKKEHFHGRFILKEVVSENPFTGDSKTIYSSKKRNIVNTAFVIKGHEIEQWAKMNSYVNRLSLTFLTPTCFKDRNNDVKEPFFNFLIRELILRTQVLYYFYHNSRELDINYQSFLQRAEKVLIKNDYTRFVSDDDRSIRENFGGKGLLGKVEYAGKIQEFLPLLKLGEFIHVGEKTVFGFGKYRLNYK